MANDPKNFRIPKDFILFGHKYNIELCEKCFSDENIYGDADDDAKKIRLQTTGSFNKTYTEADGKSYTGSYTGSYTITPETLIETYYHEMSHIIFSALGEDEKPDNEKLVNMIGKAWLEIYLSANYEEENS